MRVVFIPNKILHLFVAVRKSTDELRELWRVFWSCGLIRSCGVKGRVCVKSLHIERKRNKCRSFPPALPLHAYVHTRLDDCIPVVMFTIGPPVMFTIYPPYAEKNSRLRFHAVHARQFQCMCPSRLGRPYRFSRFANSKSSTGILWYVTFDIRQCHKGFVRNCESHSATSPLGHTFWRKCQSNNFIDFLLRRVTRVLWGASHITQHRLYLQCSLVNICLCSSFETSRRFLRAFSLGKRNDARQGLAASHVNSHWLVNAGRIRGMWQDFCNARLLWKKPGMWERSAASHINLQEHCTQDAFYLRKHTESGMVSATHVLVEKRYGIRERLVAGHMNLQPQGTQDAFLHKDSGAVGTARIFQKNTTISPGWAGVTCKFTVKWSPGAFYMRKHNDFPAVGGSDMLIYSEMKPRRILHEKTQRFPRGRREWHVNLQSKWRPGAFYMRKHNDFSASDM